MQQQERADGLSAALKTISAAANEAAATAAAQAASRAALVCLAALSHLHSSLIWSLERALADGTARPPHRDRTPPLAVVLPSPSGAWTAEPAEVRGADKRRL